VPPTSQKETCGACIAYLGQPPDSLRGRCQLRPELGTFAHTLPCCTKYVERGTGARYTPPKVARAPRQNAPAGAAPAAPARPKLYGKSIDLGDQGDGPMDTEALRQLFTDVLQQEGLLGTTAMGARWEGGTLVLKPGDPSLQSKEVPLDVFFQKILMVREKLRVLEQKLNGHEKLSRTDKAEFQQAITRAYGSLTTFNILFADKQDHFVGAASTAPNRP
jgi:hypothetical protein